MRCITTVLPSTPAGAGIMTSQVKELGAVEGLGIILEIFTLVISDLNLITF